MKSVRVGVIGCGAIACRAHIPGFSPKDSPAAALAIGGYQYGGCPNSVVAAVSDVDMNRAKQVANKFDVPKAYGDWKSIINDPDIDAVSICTPNSTHAEIAIAAMEKGKHVLVEKPIANTVAEADAMIAAAEKNGVILMVEQPMRFAPMHEIAKKLIEDGHIGRIQTIKTRFGHQGPAAWGPSSQWFYNKNVTGHGAMIDLGIHDVDLIRWLVGAEITEVAGFATYSIKEAPELEDNAIGIVKFENGVIGIVEASWTQDPNEWTAVIYGTKGVLRLPRSDDNPMYVEIPTQEKWNFKFEAPAGGLTKATYKPVLPGTSKLGGPFRHFVDCILENKTPLTSGVEGRNSLAAAIAILESSKTGTFVKPE